MQNTNGFPPKREERPIDQITDGTHRRLGDSLTLVKKSKIRTWQALLLVLFAGGVTAAILGSIALNIETESDAARGIQPQGTPEKQQLFIEDKSVAAQEKVQKFEEKQDGRTIRGTSRVIKLNQNAFENQDLILDLPGGERVSAKRTRLEKANFNGEVSTWVGQVGNDPADYTILTKKGDALVGTVRRGNRMFDVQYDEELQTPILSEIDTTKPVPGDTHLTVTPEMLERAADSEETLMQIELDKREAEKSIMNAPRLENEEVSWKNQIQIEKAEAYGHKIIDVMFVYSDLARANAGGYDGIIAQIYNVVAQTNWIFANSQAGVELRLVGFYEAVGLDSLGNQHLMLDALINGSDGRFDWVNQNRKSLAADLVVAIDGANHAASCSVGYMMKTLSTSFSPQAFSVVSNKPSLGCINTYAVAHEIGHNMGSDHEYARRSSDVHIFPYSYGFQSCDGKNPNYGDVMSHAGTSKALCAPSYKAPLFSNPRVAYGGVAMGITNQADSASALYQSRHTVALFERGYYDLPLPPKNTTGVKVSATSIKITWKDNSTNELGFRVYRRKSTTSWILVGNLSANVKTFTNTGVSKGTYLYGVKSYNAMGESDHGAFSANTVTVAL